MLDRKAVVWCAAMVAAVVILGAVAVRAESTSVGGGAVPSVALINPCDVTVFSENLAGDAVQAAINAFPGQTICVGAGSFPEQLTINSSGTTLRGAGADKTFIDPNEPLTLNTHDYNQLRGLGTERAAAIILVEGSSGDPTTGVSGVTIEDLQVNGTAGQSTFTNCSYSYLGVDFQASSGTLTNAQVVGISLPSLVEPGCYQGIGVYAYHGWRSYGSLSHAPDSVTVSHTLVTSYLWTGIICSDPSESCTITSSSIIGPGPTNQLIQSGIAVYADALVTIQHNTISGNAYTGGPSPHNDWYIGDQAAGVLLSDSASGSTVNSNSVSMNQVGIAYQDDGTFDSGSATTTISLNTLDTSSAYAIVAVGAPGGGDLVYITGNTIDNALKLDPSIYGAPGILVDTGTFLISLNKVIGSDASSGASNGASQEVCGPTDLIFCSSAMSLTTAAVQAASESGTNPTNVTSTQNAYPAGTDTYTVDTLGVDGGYVNLLES